MTNFFQNLRYSFRQLGRNPGFAIVCVLTLALGIGANTAVFTVMNAVLLKSLPVADPDQVVYLRTSNPPMNTGTIDWNQTFSYSVYDGLRRQEGALTDRSALSEVMAYVPLSTAKVAVRMGNGAAPEEAEGEMVSGNFFSGLGVPILRGRGFNAQDESSHAPYAVLSYNYWNNRFASDPGVLGKTIYVNGVALTIIGIARQGFEGLESGQSTDFWIPLQNRIELNAWGNPPDHGKLYSNNPTWWCLRLIARLSPGVTKTQAAQALQSAFQSAAYVGLGSPMPGEHLPVLGFEDAKSFPGYEAQYGKPLRMLMAMVLLVLLIALSNVAMLLMARNATRQREFSLRMALGAGRGQLFRQLLTESLLLVTVGGALAWLFANAASRALGSWARIETTLAPDRAVLVFTLSILVVAALLFGLAPLRRALIAGPQLTLKSSSATSQTDASSSRTSRITVVLQMALCVVLLVGAGLLVRTLRNLESIPLGFSTDGLIVFSVNPKVESLSQGRAFYQNLTQRLQMLPGVESVSVSEERLGSMWSDNSAMRVDGKIPTASNGGDTTVRSNVVGPGFFHTLGVPVLKGRDFRDSDTATSPHVGIINELFAKRFFPNQDPIGHTIGTDNGEYSMTVVGIVKDHKYRSIDETPIPMAWYEYAQIPMVSGMSVEMRVSTRDQGDPLAILPSAQKALQQIDPGLPLIQPMTQRAQYETTISQQLLFARLAGFFGLLAVLLVATGLYGTLAYRVNNRTAEIGVRMALGAQRGQVVWMVLRESLVLTALGMAIGVPLAGFVSRVLASSLYGVQPYDLVTYSTALYGVVIVALVASLIPARRAAAIEPQMALRSE
jgi:predicted permease